MGIGTRVRRSLGPFELPAAKLYRSYFVNLGDLARTLASLTPADRILEIGCGEGRVATALCAEYPNARYLGIDIAPNPGRLFTGDRSRATFRSRPAGELIAESNERFGLVVMIDVLHHVPPELREHLLEEARALTAPGGVLAVKDWLRGRNISHAVAYAADRYLSGDANVAFPTMAQLRTTICAGASDFRVICETRIPPRRNNVLFALRKC